jgi:hypothetical protein
MISSQLIPAVATFIAVTVQTLIPGSQTQKPNILASHVMPMNDRYPVSSVSDVFKDNILLTIGYMRGLVTDPSHIDWNRIEKPFHYEFTLKPHENFAFHDDVLPQYKGLVTQSTHARFNYTEGFKSDGYLVGDGVCHLASIINWVAKDSGLESLAPTNHDFANIPEVPKEEGVAIFDSPDNASTSAQENLYITNTKDKPVTFAFDYENNRLTVTTTEDN